MNNNISSTAAPKRHARRSTFVALAFAAVLASCGGSDGSNSQPYNPPPPPQLQPGGIAGRVLSASDGQPVAGATVTLDGTTTVTTGADGTFSFTGLTEVDRVPVTISAAGYPRIVRFTSVTGSTVTTLPVQLPPVAATVSVDAAVGGTASVGGSTAQAVFPAGAIVAAGGAAPTQPALVQVTPINTAEDTNLLTGDYRSGASAWLETYGAVSVVLTDAGGASYDLGAGQNATIRIPVSTRASGTLPATVPLYWFDEATGFWTAEGTATLAGTAPNRYYEGTVTRANVTWSASAPISTVLVTGCVRDMTGAAVRRARIEVDGVTYSGTSSALSNDSGIFSVPVRSNATAAVVARSGARLSNARGVTTQAANVSLGSSCLIFADAAISIKLTWGVDPDDVDSHLLTPQGTHIDYTNKGTLTASPFANLDIDDTTSFGPEYVTIRRVAQGTYRYFLHNYSGTFSPGMTGSPVKVEVTRDGNTTVFRPGAGEGTTNEYWHAFDIVVDNQCNVTITPANTWSTAEPANPNMNGGAVTYCD
ncbi:MAG TPA: carboxypeptidase regulatory-like domain-containing protein [Rhizobacter sp.]